MYMQYYVDEQQLAPTLADTEGNNFCSYGTMMPLLYLGIHAIILL